MKQSMRQTESLRKKHEVERRTNPKTAKDFELLYNELEDWVQQEVAQLKGFSGAERKERMSDILAKQTKALQTIDSLKAKALTQGKQKKISKMLEVMSQPKQWE